ncbi:hypothetical protein GCM10009609_66200 [Pseudonocardia aurantiaca]|uniref:DUF5666 domain-containing protein n=1 Tax=Pseudonocardia aurantiaca TaxID=75290 RepID=A0ABW4FQZ4_9PSEU
MITLPDESGPQSPAVSPADETVAMSVVSTPASSAEPVTDAIPAVPPADTERQAEEPPDEGLFEQGWDKPKRTSRFTIVLVAALLVVLGFAGGALAEQSVGAAPAAGAPQVGAAAGAGARRSGQGAPPTGLGASPANGTPAAPGAAGPGAAPPTATGTIRSIDGNTLALTDDAGAAVTVSVSDSASVTTRGLGSLAVGTSVSVVGSKGPDGSIMATSVTAR